MDTRCAQVSYIGATMEGILRVLEPLGRGSRPNRPRRRNLVSPIGEIRLPPLPSRLSPPTKTVSRTPIDPWATAGTVNKATRSHSHDQPVDQSEPPGLRSRGSQGQSDVLFQIPIGILPSITRIRQPPTRVAMHGKHIALLTWLGRKPKKWPIWTWPGSSPVRAGPTRLKSYVESTTWKCQIGMLWERRYLCSPLGTCLLRMTRKRPQSLSSQLLWYSPRMEEPASSKAEPPGQDTPTAPQRATHRTYSPAQGNRKPARPTPRLRPLPPTTPRWEKPLTRASICQYGSSCSFIPNRAVDTSNLLNRTVHPPRAWTLEVGFWGAVSCDTRLFCVWWWWAVYSQQSFCTLHLWLCCHSLALSV